MHSCNLPCTATSSGKRLDAQAEVRPPGYPKGRRASLRARCAEANEQRPLQGKPLLLVLAAVVLLLLLQMVLVLGRVGDGFGGGVGVSGHVAVSRVVRVVRVLLVVLAVLVFAQKPMDPNLCKVSHFPCTLLLLQAHMVVTVAVAGVGWWWRWW